MNAAKSLLALSRYQAKKESYSYEEEIRKLKDLVKKQDVLLKKLLEKKELDSDKGTKRADSTKSKE